MSLVITSWLGVPTLQGQMTQRIHGINVPRIRVQCLNSGVVFEFGCSYDVIPAMYGIFLTATSNNLTAIRTLNYNLSSVRLLLQEGQCIDVRY
jgi:hypothetical protein